MHIQRERKIHDINNLYNVKEKDGENNKLRFFMIC